LAVDRWPKREGASANGQRPTANEKASYGLQLRPYAERSMVERVRTEQEE